MMEVFAPDLKDRVFLNRWISNRGGRSMRQRKFKFLLVALLVASGLLLAGGEARANFSSFCYRVDNTITINNDSGEFMYHFSPLSNCSSNTSVKNVLFEIPADVPLNNLVTTYKTGSGGFLPINCTALAAGAGDPDTRLGVSDPRYRVLTCTSPTSGGFPRDYWIKLALTNINVTGKKLEYSLQVVQLKAGNSLSDTDVTNLPSLTDQPTPPPPVLGSFTAKPNPVQQIFNNSNATCTTLSWNATTGSTVVLLANNNPLASDQPASGTYTDCPTATTTYQATASNANGYSTPLSVIVTVNQAMGPGTFSEFKATPSSITSGEQPLCVTLSWAGPTGTVAISAGGETLASGLPANGTFSVCPAVTTEYTATASNTGGTTSTTATVSVNDPVIQTSCMQILKKPLGAGPTCTNVCFEIGGERRLVSAEIFYNDNCSGTGTPLAVFGPDVSNPALRVPSLTCFPCDVAAGELRTPQCYGVPYQGTSMEPPFDIDLGTHKVRCEFIIKSYEPSGYTVDLGADPQFWNGARWINTPSCPTGYYDCKGTCKKTGTTCL